MQDARPLLSTPGEQLADKERYECREKCRLFFKQTQDSEEERKKMLKQ